MHPGNLITLSIVFGVALLLLQRTLKQRRILTLLLVVLPTGYLSYDWARFEGQLREWLLAAGVALAFNAIYWLFYGRRHPPGSQGDVVVAGKEDLD